MPDSALRHSARAVRAWIVLSIALVFAMVVVGGITRLTGSGLSIVEWAPIMGAVPPLDEAAWNAAFEAYKQYPQYRLTHPTMDLDGFKDIFFWEYLHRLLGRAIGLVFALPFFWFLARGAFSRALALRLAVALGLGALQGLMGWLMVKSGLVDEPRVSHFRLAAHLGLALLIMAWLAWILFDLLPPPVAQPRARSPRLLVAVGVVLALQILYGAFVAGARAGWGYNTFPLMGDRWIAEAVMAMQPWWLNLLASHATLQFLHRVLGTLLLLLVVVLWWQRRTHLLLVLVLLQYALGVYILVKVVPLVPAVMHQGVAALVLLAFVHVCWRQRSLSRPAA
jgi:cytochrome c oxidase assembly protein subunit 15